VADSLLLTAGFSPHTGYAWGFIYQLLNRVALRGALEGYDAVLLFGRLDAPVNFLDPVVRHHAYEWPVLEPRLWDLWRLGRIVRRHRVRYAYLTDQPTWHPMYAVLRLLGVRRIVVHSHVSVPDPAPPPPGHGWRWRLKRMLHHTAFGADHVVAVSQFVKHRLVHLGGCPQDRVSVALNGVPVDRVAPPARTPDAGRPIKVFCAARATRFKGIQVLIEAVWRLQDRQGLPPFVVEYAGDGPDLEAFRGQVEQLSLGQVFMFLGPRTDVAALMRCADIVVVPSVWGDACPLTVLEAMAAGAAVVASAVGGIPELVGDEGAGVLVPHGDARALADALAGLLADPARRQAMGAAGWRRVDRDFRFEDFVARLLAVVERALGWGGGGSQTIPNRGSAP
jgi:glycosyltransferase involved in cell wall biosynthesis